MPNVPILGIIGDQAYTLETRNPRPWCHISLYEERARGRTFDEGEAAEEHDEDKHDPGQVEGDHHRAADGANHAKQIDGHLVRQEAQQPEREVPAPMPHRQALESCIKISNFGIP